MERKMKFYIRESKFHFEGPQSQPNCLRKSGSLLFHSITAFLYIYTYIYNGLSWIRNTSLTGIYILLHFFQQGSNIWKMGEIFSIRLPGEHVFMSSEVRCVLYPKNPFSRCVWIVNASVEDKLFLKEEDAVEGENCYTLFLHSAIDCRYFSFISVHSTALPQLWRD